MSISLIFLTLILRAAVGKTFSDFMWSEQASAHGDVVRYLENYYASFGTWNGFDGTRLGDAAKKSLTYYTLYSIHNQLIWSTETDLEPCCDNPDHKYYRDVHPVIYQGAMVAKVSIGQYTDHLTSPENIAFQQSLSFGIGISLLLSLIISLSLALMLASRLSAPIKVLREAADKMSKGNHGFQLDNTSSINEIQSLTDSINHLSQSLLEQKNMRKILTKSVSHELRTPLNVMQNQLEGMIDGILPNDSARLEGVLNEINRLTSLIGELEKITEIESDEFTPAMENIDLSSFVTQVVSGFEGSFSRKDVELVVELTDSLQITADKDKLTQLLINIISNAYKFTTTGSVTVKTYVENEHNVFECIDTGIGIAKADLDRIFERFYRVEQSGNRQTGGAGLGLAIAKKIADAHKWKIVVNSELDKGTSFKIIF